MRQNLMISIKDLIHIRQTLLELECGVTKESDHLGLFKPEIQIEADLSAKVNAS